jgi:hypothetical protein
MVVMLVKLNRLPLRITEVPVILRCAKREGTSKMKRRNTIKGYLKFIIRQLFRSRRRDTASYNKFVNGK